MISMEDIVISNTEYTSDNGSKVQKPHNVVVNGERVGQKLVYDFDKEDKQTTQVCGNAQRRL